MHVDLIELHLQGKQAHWNIVGKNFHDLHLQLDEIVASAREFSDVIGERLRALPADLPHQVIATLEHYAWMVSAENRTPASK